MDSALVYVHQDDQEATRDIRMVLYPQTPENPIPELPPRPVQCKRRNPLLTLVVRTPLSQALFLTICAVYMAMALKYNNSSFSGCTLLDWQARTGYNTIAQGQLWRLITAAFLHQNPIHLATNLAGAIYLLFAAEVYLSTPLFFVFCLGSWLICGATSAIADPYKIACGFSGTLLASLLLCLVCLVDEHTPETRMKTFFMAPSYILGFASVVTMDFVFPQSTDSVLHYTSIIYGFLCGLLYTRLNHNTLLSHRIIFLICLALCLWITVLPVFATHTHIELRNCSSTPQ